MLKPKVQQRQHWTDISDDELLSTDLTTENPLGIPGLVNFLPEGDDEPHVEFSYDLRGSGAEEFSCVHGHHRHLKGYVFRKGAHRYLVGWMCGETIYGTKFNEYTSDFQAAQTRQTGLRRIRDLREALLDFSAWAGKPYWEPAVEYYGELRQTLRTQMPFVWDTVGDNAGSVFRDALMPRHLCTPPKDPYANERLNPLDGQYHRLTVEIIASLEMLATPQRALAHIGGVIEGLQGIIRRTDVLLQRLEDVELFFQPATLLAISDHAENAKPRRARHIAGMLKLATKNVVVQLPPDYKTPSRSYLDALIKVVSS
ncbi:hypothetical protein [Tardiphaga sp. 803_E3_N1_3]|uniref:hypothetical protein n=1 Tax=Tardiphaga sp. 803_E3_N1_3 TaxID=3240785 RepID=UPI003F22DAEF